MLLSQLFPDGCSHHSSNWGYCFFWIKALVSTLHYSGLLQKRQRQIIQHCLTDMLWKVIPMFKVVIHICIWSVTARHLSWRWKWNFYIVQKGIRGFLKLVFCMLGDGAEPYGCFRLSLSEAKFSMKLEVVSVKIIESAGVAGWMHTKD